MPNKIVLNCNVVKCFCQTTCFSTTFYKIYVQKQTHKDSHTQPTIFAIAFVGRFTHSNQNFV